MIKRMNWIKLCAVLFISFILPFLLISNSIIDIQKITELGNDFHYNIISTSSIIGGFLFTGISILISAIDKERIKRLWENNYLDNLYRAAFVGMFANVFSIIASSLFLICKLCKNISDIIIYIEVIGLFVGIIFFLWCIKKLISIMSKLKKQ